MEHANIKSEIGSQFLRHRFQDFAIPAVAIDNGEVACRQAAPNFTSEITHECSHALN